MTDQEVNKIIAGFMGGFIKYCEDTDYFEDFAVIIDNKKQQRASKLFTKSLDALVPVWDKLDTSISMENFQDFSGKEYWAFCINDTEFSGRNKTIQQAAAHATAKAIEELEK